MRKILLPAALVLILVSCLSSPPQYTSTLEDTYNDGVMGVSLLGLVPAGSSSPEGLTVQCVNNSASQVIVKWEKSTIALDTGMHPVFLESQYSQDARQASPDSLIPAGSQISATVYPANDVSSVANGWGTAKTVIVPFRARQISLSICVNVNGEDRFYTLKLSEDEPPPQAQHTEPP